MYHPASSLLIYGLGAEARELDLQPRGKESPQREGASSQPKPITVHSFQVGDGFGCQHPANKSPTEAVALWICSVDPNGCAGEG